MSVETEKRHFYSWNQNSSSIFRLWNIDIFIVRLMSASEREVPKLVYHIFLTVNNWHKTVITHGYDLASPQIQRNQIRWKHEHYDYDPCLEMLMLSGSTELTAHVWWIKFVKEILLVSNFIIRIQSFLNVCNNTICKQKLSFSQYISGVPNFMIFFN